MKYKETGRNSKKRATQENEGEWAEGEKWNGYEMEQAEDGRESLGGVGMIRKIG